MFINPNVWYWSNKFLIFAVAGLFGVGGLHNPTHNSVQKEFFALDFQKGAAVARDLCLVVKTERTGSIRSPPKKKFFKN